MRCVTTVSYSFRINGKISNSFQPLRGIRQGDPLSPYLFLIVVEGLSALIKKSVEEGVLEGILSVGGDLKFHTYSSPMIASFFARLLYLIVILYNGFSKCIRWHQVNNLIVLKLLCFLAPTP